MSNNTKLIMETWRRFLNEAEMDVQMPEAGEPPFESDIPVEEDAIDEEAFELNESAKRMQKLANIVKG